MSSSPSEPDIKSHFQLVRSIDIAVVTTLMIINISVITFIIRRRQLQPIKVKGWKLITLSLIGNMLVIFSDFFIKYSKSFLNENEQLVENGYPALWNLNDANSAKQHINETMCTSQSLRVCLFWPVFFIPYFLRSIRLMKIF